MNRDTHEEPHHSVGLFLLVRALCLRDLRTTLGGCFNPSRASQRLLHEF
jgi:hypothetical protein